MVEFNAVDFREFRGATDEIQFVQQSNVGQYSVIAIVHGQIPIMSIRGHCPVIIHLPTFPCESGTRSAIAGSYSAERVLSILRRRISPPYKM